MKMNFCNNEADDWALDVNKYFTTLAETFLIERLFILRAIENLTCNPKFEGCCFLVDAKDTELTLIDREVANP